MPYLLIVMARLARLVLGHKWRRLECRYLAAVANRREEHLDLLLTCVGGVFYGKDKNFSAIRCHIQPLPGFCLKDEERTSDICWEAPVCVTVYSTEKPILGMAVEFRGPVICIRQLQGVPGVDLPESLKKWPAMFVEGVKTFLLNAPEIHTARLYAADTRPSYKYPADRLIGEELVRYQRNLRRRYDGTARQCGFQKTSHGKYWVWDISMHQASEKGGH